MTVKQKNALNRILNREQKIHPDRAGLHASLDKWTISDGAVAVLFYDKPDTVFSEAVRMDKIAQFIQTEFENADYTKICTPIDIPEWKIATKGYQQKFIRSKETPPIPDFHAFALDYNGNTRDAHFNLQFVLDAVEAVGSKAIAFLPTKPRPIPTLLVMHEDWMEDSAPPIAIVMPVRQAKPASK